VSDAARMPLCAQCHREAVNRPLPPWVVNFFLSVAILVVVSVPWNWRFLRGYAEFRRGLAAFKAHDLEASAALTASAFARVPESSSLESTAAFIDGLRLLAADRDEEALGRLKTARVNAPPGADVDAMIVRAKIGIAFKSKDYKAFLAMALGQFSGAPRSAQYAAQVASAYACVYAAGGRDADKTKTLEYMALARSLGAPEEAVAEYEPRIRHRLATRVIIDRTEYMKRFPHGWKEDG
jgi:hypothetical protein